MITVALLLPNKTPKCVFFYVRTLCDSAASPVFFQVTCHSPPALCLTSMYFLVGMTVTGV